MPIESIQIPDDLFRDARNGDPTALSALWDVCTPIIAQAVRWNPPGAARTIERIDVVQEAARIFLEALRHDDVPDAASFQHFLWRKLPNRLTIYLRAERRRLGRQVLIDEPLLEGVLSRRHLGSQPHGPPGRQLARALERLSPKQRAVIQGLYAKEQTVRELTEELGISQQAVGALHQRALATLRRLLSAPNDSSSPAEPEEAPP